MRFFLWCLASDEFRFGIDFHQTGNFCKFGLSMKSVFFLIILFLLAGIAFANEEVSTWSEARMNGKGSVKIYYYDSDHFISGQKGKLSGIEYELFIEFFRILKDSLNIEIRYEFIKAPSFGELYEKIKNGEAGIFGACSFSITEKRKTEVQFSPKYIPDIEVLISSQNLPVAADTNEFIRIFSRAKGLSVPNTTFENNILELKKILPHMQVENTAYASTIRERISTEPDLFSYIELPNYFVSISKGIRLKRQSLFKAERQGYAIIYPKKSDWTEIVEIVFNSYDFKIKTNEIIKNHLGEEVNDLLWNVASEKEFLKNKEIVLLTKEREIQNLEIEKKELQLTKQKFFRNVLMVSVSAALIVLFLIYNRYRMKQKTSKIIEEKNKELERLSIVARETKNVILIMDADGKLEWVNQSFEKLNAITLPELKKLKGETIFEISNNPNIRKIVDESIREKKPVTYESLNRTRDGKTVWESSTLTPIFDSACKLKNLIIIDSDITDRKFAEEIIREKNKNITDSINYAVRIQQALLPDHQKIKLLLPESFVLFKPRDIVSGDFYFIEPIRMNDGTILAGFAAGDCTGHGVPGAFMSMLGTSFLKQSLSEKSVNNPAEALDFVSKKINDILTHHDELGMIRDGMDIAFCVLNPSSLGMYAAGAERPVIIIGKDGLREIKGDKRPVGYSETNEPFTNHTVKLEKGDCVYLFSDGYSDQFGGPKGKKFKYKRLQETLLANCKKTMAEQKKILDNIFEEWKGNLEQVDDVCVMGVRV